MFKRDWARDLETILEPYPTSIYKIISKPKQGCLVGLGDNLRWLGTIQRFTENKFPNYNDKDVEKFLYSIGDDPLNYVGYKVTPRTVELAEKSLKRYDRDPDPYSDEIKRAYSVAADWMEIHFSPYMCNSKVATYDTVIEKLKGDKSPGLPWTSKYREKDDYWLTEEKEDLEFFSHYWDRLETNNPIQSLSSVSSKEEMRETEKVDSGSIRTIIAMDVNHVVAQNMLCHEQNEKLKASCLKHSMTLGLDIHGGGFHRLNSKMQKWPGKNTIEIDGVKFDGKFRWLHFQKIRDFRWKMLCPEDRILANYVRLHNIYWQLAHSPLVNIDGRVYKRDSGNPSGQGCTTEDNGLKNFMDSCVWWILNVPPEFRNYSDFIDNTERCITGDDINLSVNPLFQQYLNVTTIKNVSKSMDMEYTFGNDEFRYNHECSFLGHTYVYLEDKRFQLPGTGMYVPTINCEKMRTSMLRYNEHGTIDYTIIRACGLRNETWACLSCRNWFNNLIDYLRVVTRDSLDVKVRDAWKNYQSDLQLWLNYTGMPLVLGVNNY
jgi:hypothetical protein